MSNIEQKVFATQKNVDQISKVSASRSESIIESNLNESSENIPGTTMPSQPPPSTEEANMLKGIVQALQQQQ